MEDDNQGFDFADNYRGEIAPHEYEDLEDDLAADKERAWEALKPWFYKNATDPD